ncbi:MauE/DoxX family redox-associated membrane protein [Planomicrobium okeanokoites]|uniref:MauE/DoxX family redox-associated membrane protein n=1 Tax=Planomicrobium okeanokoites TaxID=244 RepID=UPI0024906A00|nr:MauE/DoxX family redox-associated membrane protein [Planomicrobium okeanokoites]
MTHLALIIQSLIIIIFLSTSLNKIIDFKEHLKIVSLYNLPFIVPGKIVVISLFFVEFLISISLLLNYSYFWTIFISIILLVLYTSIVIYQLKTSSVQINCGCGGLLNSENLSIETVYRNGVLISLLIILIVFPHPVDEISQILPYFTIGLLIALSYYMYVEYRNRVKKIQFLEEEVFNSE